MGKKDEYDRRKNEGVAEKKATGKSSKKEEEIEERGPNRGEMMEEKGTSCLRKGNQITQNSRKSSTKGLK